MALTENHLRRLLHECAAYYNKGRPHMDLEPGIPPLHLALPVPSQEPRHHMPKQRRGETTEYNICGAQEGGSRPRPSVVVVLPVLAP